MRAGTQQVRSAAVYTRISLDSDGQGAGVERQRRDCLALAEQLGWPVGDVYEDNDVSAYSGRRRPAYERLIADLESGARDAVIVYHLDRLTRRPLELEQFLAVIDRAGVRQVRFVSGNADVGTSDGLMVLRIQAAVAAQESATKSRRVIRKMQDNAEKGLPHGMGTRPFGYEADGITIRKSEADVIRTLAARYLAGESLRSLAGWLEDEQIPSAAGGTWRTEQVRQVLIGGRIAGLRDYRGEASFEAVWPAIISRQDHDRIKARMESRAATGKRSPRRYLLSGMCRCGKCAQPLYSAARPDYRRYECRSGADFTGCGRLTIKAEPVETIIADLVMMRLDTPELADALAGRAASNERAAAAAEEASQARQQRDELAQAYAQRLISMPEWLTARKPVEDRLAKAERALAEATDTDALSGLVGNATSLRQEWDGLNLSRQHAIVAAVLDHVVIAAPSVSGGKFDPTRVQPVWRL